MAFLPQGTRCGGEGAGGLQGQGVGWRVEQRDLRPRTGCAVPAACTQPPSGNPGAPPAPLVSHPFLSPLRGHQAPPAFLWAE